MAINPNTKKNVTRKLITAAAKKKLQRDIMLTNAVYNAERGTALFCAVYAGDGLVKVITKEVSARAGLPVVAATMGGSILLNMVADKKERELRALCFSKDPRTTTDCVNEALAVIKEFEAPEVEDVEPAEEPDNIIDFNKPEEAPVPSKPVAPASEVKRPAFLDIPLEEQMDALDTIQENGEEIVTSSDPEAIALKKELDEARAAFEGREAEEAGEEKAEAADEAAEA